MNSYINSFIWSVVAGIVSSILVTLYYRWKDNKIDRIECLIEIEKDIYNLSIDIMPLNNIYGNNMDRLCEKLSRKYLVRRDVGIVFTPDEKMFVDDYVDVHNNIILCVQEINLCEMKINDSDISPIERVEAETKLKEVEGELNFFWSELNTLLDRCRILIKEF